jgi:protein O-GlcNAc transferase
MHDVERVLQDALAFGEEGEWEAMAGALRQALDEAADDPYLLCWLGVAEQELGNDGAAYDYFRQALAQNPLDPNLLAMAGSGLAAFDDPDAEAALRAAALTGPDLPMARLQYGAYLARSGVFEEAFEQLHAARELAPEDPTVHSALGIAHALRGDYALATDAMETALELAPDDAWTRVLLGLAYLELRSFEEAAEALIQAAEEQEDDAEAHILAALAAAAVGWDDAAHAALARVEYVATDTDLELRDEAEERIFAGAEAARGMLLESLAPVALRDRLAQPL